MERSRRKFQLGLQRTKKLVLPGVIVTGRQRMFRTRCSRKERGTVAAESKVREEKKDGE